MLTRKHKRIVKRICKRASYGEDWLQQRALMKQRIEDCTENGMIAICRSGHDCDHMHYNSVRVDEAPRNFFAWLHAERRHQECLDGPESMRIDKPSNVEEGYSCRDVAAELAGY